MQVETASKIQLLPEHIIDQIKAGEVIERPSTLLKELLENSIDAGATSIEVEIIDNGLELLSVKDNGKGIPFEDLDLAFCRHATSKIERFEDIYNLFTYGFRGEALASIAAVSRLTCVTNTKNSPEGTIKINGGETVTLDQDSDKREDSSTAIYIRELFYNTPVRMKFIQSKTSEKNQLEKILKAFLLTHPEVKFSIKWDEQDKLVYSPQTELHDRVVDTIKKNRSLHLKEFRSQYDNNSFKVFLSQESSRGNAGKSQFIFVNDRLVQDIQIHKIILNSAQRLWPLGESGNYVAYLEVPAESLDVNIHPNKTQVKFFESSKVYSLISAAIKEGISKMESPELESIEQKRFDLGDKAQGLKEVGYRQFDFDSSNSSLDDYFKGLDEGTAPSRENYQQERQWESVVSFDEVSIIKADSKLYAVNTSKLMALWLNKLINSSDKTPMPLLVSQPLDIKGVKKIILKKINSYGFEIDKLGGTDYVLRSFPSSLKNFPFREYLAASFEYGGEFEHIILNQRPDWKRYHLKAIEDLGISQILEASIASEITQEKVKKLL